MPIWKQECARLNIPFIQRTKDSPPAPTSDGPSAEPFTREGLAERIAMFVSSSRQVRCTVFWVYVRGLLLTKVAVGRDSRKPVLPGFARIHR